MLDAFRPRRSNVVTKDTSRLGWAWRRGNGDRRGAARGGTEWGIARRHCHGVDRSGNGILPGAWDKIMSWCGWCGDIERLTPASQDGRRGDLRAFSY